MAVSPSTFLRDIFFGKVLRIIDEHVCALGELAYIPIEHRIARLVIGGIHHHAVFGFDAKAKAALRVIQPHGMNHAAVKFEPAGIDVAKLTARGHLVHLDRKIRIRHLLFQGPLQPTRSAGRVKDERALVIVVERSKKRNALDVVPVEVGEKNVRRKRLSAGFLLQVLAEDAEAGAAIKNVDLSVDTDFDAGGVASIAQIFRLGRRCGAANPPESNQHPSPLSIFLCARAPCETNKLDEVLGETPFGGGLSWQKYSADARKRGHRRGNQTGTYTSPEGTCPFGPCLDRRK